MADAPILILNPRDDHTFAARATHLVSSGAGQSPEVLQAALREWYPDVVVRPRSLADEQPVVWYVYRLGRWVLHGPLDSDPA